MATIITDAMLARLRAHILDSIAYARYRIDGVWQRAEISSAEIKANGAVHLSFYIRRADGSASPADCFHLCAADGTVLAEKSENVAFAQYMEAILYRFRFGVTTITEVE